MGEIAQGLERAAHPARSPDTETRLRFLLAAHQGSTRQVAAVLEVSQRTVQRWVTKKPGARRSPGPAQIQVIEEAVSARWQPRVRARRQTRAEAEGFVLHQGAVRIRRRGPVLGRPAGAAHHPAPVRGGRSRTVRRAGRRRGEQQQMVILARALGHAYFRDGGRRAHGLGIAFTDVEFADFSIG